MTTERQDYFAPGLWNACCDGCSAKLKSNELRKDWQGFMKCRRCWEPRHPQDYVRAGRDPAPLPWTRPCGGATIASFCVAPTASIVIDIDPVEDYKIYFSTNAISTEACPLEYTWGFGDGGGGGGAGGTSTAASGSYTYAAAGSYTISLQVTNSGGTSLATYEITFISSIATTLFIDFDIQGIAYAFDYGVTFDGPFGYWDDWSGSLFDIFISPNGGRAGGFHSALSGSSMLAINIDTSKLQARNLSGQRLYSSSPNFRVYVEGGGSFLVPTDIASSGIPNGWTVGDILTSAQITAAGYPTEFIERIEFNLGSGSYMLLDALYFSS